MQYVYLIKCGQYHKIGMANEVESRLAQLQTGNPILLSVEEVYGYKNAEIVEKSLHQRFESKRGVGEWFELGENGKQEFCQICSLLGGVRQNDHPPVTDDAIEEAEEVGEYTPTVEDIKRIINDPNYRLEYRNGENGLRGYAWRKRKAGRESPVYVGQRSPIFAEVKALVEGST